MDARIKSGHDDRNSEPAGLTGNHVDINLEA